MPAAKRWTGGAALSSRLRSARRWRASRTSVEQLRISKRIAALALVFGAGHRLVCQLQQFLETATMVRRQGDAHARRQLCGGAGRERERLLDRLQDAVGNALDFSAAANVRNQHRELIAAASRDRVVRTQRARQTLRHFTQCRVADLMAMAIVDLLETV